MNGFGYKSKALQTKQPLQIVFISSYCSGTVFLRNQMQQEIWLRVEILPQIHIVTFHAMSSSPHSLSTWSGRNLYRERNFQFDLIPQLPISSFNFFFKSTLEVCNDNVISNFLLLFICLINQAKAEIGYKWGNIFHLLTHQKKKKENPTSSYYFLYL